MYTRAFSHIVGAINDAVEVKTSNKTTVIGVLDIYGRCSSAVSQAKCLIAVLQGLRSLTTTVLNNCASTT
jgi:hypothetical protein